MNTVRLRLATLNDLRIIKALHKAQNERDHTNYPLPRFFNDKGQSTEQVPVSLVGVRDGSDEPVQGLWVERRAELMIAGCDAEATAFARRDIDGLSRLLHLLGYNGLHCDTPIQWKDTIAKPLAKAGFESTNERLAHFYREV